MLWNPASSPVYSLARRSDTSLSLSLSLSLLLAHYTHSRCLARGLRSSMADEDAEPGYKVTYLDGEKEALDPGWLPRPGRARVDYANGDSFVGSFNKFLKRSGGGTYTWVQDGEEDEDGNPTKVPVSSYAGEYCNGERHGLGVRLLHPNPCLYQIVVIGGMVAETPHRNGGPAHR